MRTSPSFRPSIALTLACVLTALIALPAQAAVQSTTFPWGPYSFGRHAQASGTITVVPAAIGPWEIPYATEVKIEVTLRDLTTSTVTDVDLCARAIFRSTRSEERTDYEHVFNCKFLTPRTFSLSFQHVRHLEVRVCTAPARRLRCAPEGTWHTIYAAR